MLETEDYGKDLATVQNLVKKHQLLEADIEAHEVSLNNSLATKNRSFHVSVTVYFINSKPQSY